MSDYVQRIIDEDSLNERTAVSQLTGSWLRVARVGWVILALAALGILIASLPGYALKMQGQFSHISPEKMTTSHLVFSVLGGSGLIGGRLAFAWPFLDVFSASL